GRKLTDGQYRYQYQGQEKDTETDKEAFEARLYDPRINRWLTIDPAKEFHSPYLAMGNNWINTIDPDGRCTECPKNAKVGDTYMHSEYGEVTYSENGWSNETYGSILDDVVLGANEMTPFDVGVEWLTGTGPAHRDFFAGDTFTEMIKAHSHVKDTEEIIARKFANNEKLLGVHRYRLNGIEGVGKYVKDYSTLLTAGKTGNLAVTYLGTYSLDYSISDVDMERRTMRIHFTVHNNSTIQSATRPPVIGYEPIWTEGPGKWIDSAFQTGPMSPKSQAIRWSSTIKF
ncbi:RHS repeat-associated core domain-containing protein, partial [Aquimarina spongiae]